MSRLRAPLCMTGLSLFSACADLPELETGTCGNGVIERGETCDTYGLAGVGARCLPPTDERACQLDCRPGEDALRPSCPPGWGCADDLCREPTGDFETPVTFEVGGVATLRAGDFDGDGKSEVLSSGPDDSYGRATLRFHHFDEDGALGDTHDFPKLVTDPVLRDITRDQPPRTDVIFSDFRVGVLQGSVDHSLVPEVFSSYLFPPTGVRMLGVHLNTIKDVAPVAILISLGDEGPGLYVPDEGMGVLQRFGDLPFEVDTLLGDPATGDLVEGPASPCHEMVMAFAGADRLWVADTCEPDVFEGFARWRSTFLWQEVPLVPPAKLDHAASVADLDGDGHLDVVMGADGKPYVAYGDGARLAPAVPVTFATISDMHGIPDAVPIAAGDVTGDGFADLLFPGALFVSIEAEPDGALQYVGAYPNPASPWTVGRIDDFNRDGHLDLAAASMHGLNITLFQGNGSFFPVPSTITTTGPVLHMVTGDLDGDQIHDLAFIEAAVTPGDRDTLRVAYGDASSLLEPKPVARLTNVQQLGTYGGHGLDHMVVATREPAGEDAHSAIILLDGSPDRIPFAPYSLSTFSSDGKLFSAGAVALAVGDYVTANQDDVFAMGADELPTGGFEYGFWLVPRIAQGRATPIKLHSYPVKPPLAPGRMLSPAQLRLNVATASADFTGDSRDDSVWVMPSHDDSRCALLVLTLSPPVAPSTEPTVAERTRLYLDEPCLTAQVEAVDADDDSKVDIVLLTGEPGSAARKLRVLWNDGTGKFTLAESTQVNPPQHAPEAFTVLSATTVRTFGLAYVTAASALRAHTQASGPRTFAAPTRIADLERGTGIVVGNFDGDGVADLAIADSGNLLIMRGKLREP